MSKGTPQEPTESHSLGYLPGLDGLRGLAIVGVLLFHSKSYGRLRGGYLGVDLFFVLSGFLITSILLAEHGRTGRIDLRAFWIRRARRLMPALLSLMPAIAIYARGLAATEELASLRVDALATLGYVANWRAIFSHRSYWEMFTVPSPLEHTWSLAIEEQFYVVWPLVVAGVLGLVRHKRAVLICARGLATAARPRALLVLCIVLGVGSCIAMTALYDESHTMRVYLGTDTRGAAILIGAALAASGLARRGGGHHRGRALDAMGMVALLVLAAAWLWLDGESWLLYRGGFWVTEIAAGALILCCVRSPGGIIARILSFRPFRAMGVISYGVYLWHWPIYVVLTEERLFGIRGLSLLLIRLLVTLSIATVSYFLLERPIRERGIAWGRPLIVVPSALALAVVFVLASTRVVVASETPLAPRVAASVSSGTAPVIAAKKPTPIPPGFIPPSSELPEGTLRVLVLGDSVALALGAQMHWAQGSIRAFIEQRAIGDCSILDGIAPVFSMSGPPHDNGNCASSWIADVTELRPDVTVIIIGGAYFSTVRVDGQRRVACHPGWHDPYVKRLSELITQMKPFTKQSLVVNAAYPTGKWTAWMNDRVDCYNAILREAADSSDATLIDLNAFACPGGKCTLKGENGILVRPDGLHFEGPGADATVQWVLGQIRANAPNAQSGEVAR